VKEGWLKGWEMRFGEMRCAKILDQGIRDKHHEDREATTIQQ